MILCLSLRYIMFKFLTEFINNKYIASFISFIKYGLIICVIPPIINYAAINKELSVLGTHGFPYDVGMGQKLFLSCKGSGVPTIIMDAPIGLNSDIYIPLQEKLSKITKVCVYDRAGLGLSERPVEPKLNSSEPKPKPKIQRGQDFTIERMVEDLRRLITSSSQQERPLMFVSSELGSMISRFYTQLYHDEVSHLVMINPLVENLFAIDDKIWNDFWYTNVVPKWYQLALGSAVGLNRIFMMTNFIKPQLTSINEDIFNRQRHLMCNPKHMFSLLDEFVNLNETLAQMKLIWSIKQFPQNVSVTILKSDHDLAFALQDFSYYDENKSSNKMLKLRQAWKKSIEFLENNLHPNAVKKDLKEESLYQTLINNSKDNHYLFDLIQNLIMQWRKTNVLNKSS